MSLVIDTTQLRFIYADSDNEDDQDYSPGKEENGRHKKGTLSYLSPECLWDKSPGVEFDIGDVLIL
jgi:hypothetical protein